MSTFFLIFNQRLENIQKISPKNDHLNKQEIQVLKHFSCFGFEKETFKYPDANFPKKELILEVSTVKRFKKIILNNFQIEFLYKKTQNTKK